MCIFWRGTIHCCVLLPSLQICLEPLSWTELTHLNFVKLPGCLITILMKIDFGKLLICCVIICAKISLNDFMLQVIKSFISQVKSNFILNIRIHNDKKIQFSIMEISIEITITTAVIKNELKYFRMSENNTCIAEPNLELLLLIWFSKD